MLNLRQAAKRLPAPLYRCLQRIDAIRRSRGRARGLPVVTSPGPLLTDLAPRLATIPGWFNLDDMAHFQLVLGTQAVAGIAGDLLEIGCFHGRCAALLGSYLRAGERLLLADAFGDARAERYGNTPTEASVRRNLGRLLPDLEPARLVIFSGLSRDWQLPETTRIRFAHVDGSHDHEDVAHDLALCARHLTAGGIIAIDDYRHPDHPGVAQAAEAFLARHPDFHILADLNRTGAAGRKLYLGRLAGAEGPASEGAGLVA